MGSVTFRTASSSNPISTHESFTRFFKRNTDEEFNLDSYMHTEYSFYKTMNDEEEQEEYLKTMDALDLLRALKALNRQIRLIKLENYVLNDFLAANDAKLLLGFKKTRVKRTPTQRVQPFELRSFHTTATVTTMSTRETTQRPSIFTLVGSSKKAIDFILNNRGKLEITERLANITERTINDIQTKVTNNIIFLNGRLDELRITYTEMNMLKKNFILHFLTETGESKYIDDATELQLEKKFLKFINNWRKNASVLLEKMRLQNTSITENCHALRTGLAEKTDMSGILGPIDFEQLQIKRNYLLEVLEDKYVNYGGLKELHGKSSMVANEERSILMLFDEGTKYFNQKSIELAKVVDNLKKEIDVIEIKNKKDEKTLKKLRHHIKRYEAPTVSQYIDHKDELLLLEKEEKILLRKISITNMELNNVLKKCKKRSTVGIKGATKLIK